MKKEFKDALEESAFNKYSDVFLNMRRKLVSGFCDSDYVDTVFQSISGYTPTNTLSFAHIHYHSLIGNIARLTVDVGYTPHGDGAIEQNNRYLSELPKLFKAEFIPESGAGAWNDGYFAAKGNVIFERTVSPHVGKQYQKLDKFLVFDIHEQRIPLEVGYTEGHITYMHLLMDGAVARWAYGSKQIVVMLVCGKISSSDRDRAWKYHKATPLDFMIAQSQGFYYEQAYTATEGKAA